MLSKAIKYLPLSLVNHKGGSFFAFRLFGVVPGRSVFLQTSTFHRMFSLTNLLKMNFITKLGKRYYKMG